MSALSQGGVTLVQHNAAEKPSRFSEAATVAVWPGVEAVLIRRVVDRSVLTADFDPGVGLIT